MKETIFYFSVLQPRSDLNYGGWVFDQYTSLPLKMCDFIFGDPLASPSFLYSLFLVVRDLYPQLSQKNAASAQCFSDHVTLNIPSFFFLLGQITL